MNRKRVTPILATVLGILLMSLGTPLFAQDHESESHEPEKLNVSKDLMEHVMDNHEFHFFNYNHHHYSIPLPVIVYTEGQGFKTFSSSRFEHGEAVHEGLKLDEKNKIVAVNEDGTVNEEAKVYDFSLTRNVVQMFIGLFILVWLMIGVARKYAKNGIKVAPTGFQNAIEPVINFIQDDVAKPNLGHKYRKYMPYLLTVFFFILIANIIGLIPGTANVSGNIAFTLVLGAISFIAINVSSNKHYWGHIFNPPGVPLGVKFILVPVEILGIITKPFALIIRLFANMIAGHMIITCLVFLIFIFAQMNKYIGIGVTPVSLAFTIFIYFIEILVAFIQAYIFTTLTAVFIGQAMEGSHGHDEHPNEIVPV